MVAYVTVVDVCSYKTVTLHEFIGKESHFMTARLCYGKLFLSAGLGLFCLCMFALVSA